ncbi:hypothetical protein EBE87_03925 [Pseudoroseomonas wenyumeiae]|uniref:Uncharacterized protein n=1 Tax=Teichococcus wenyumeiae TaxID=2478470 RepID=A0A3A9J5R7_9PROT|nr:hypothetical protein D6Z83_25950 [Pseudoroseomonas wenyumeiae]RMI26434.1 hypothetical protein EBE87_03925 [Pseudoroseomonas wenyumeiae]
MAAVLGPGGMLPRGGMVRPGALLRGGPGRGRGGRGGSGGPGQRSRNNKGGKQKTDHGRFSCGQRLQAASLAATMRGSASRRHGPALK